MSKNTTRGNFRSRDSRARSNPIPQYTPAPPGYADDERSPLLQHHMDGSDAVCAAHPGLTPGKSPVPGLLRFGAIVVIAVFLIEVWSFASLMRLSKDIHAEDRSRQPTREKWALEVEQFYQKKAMMDESMERQRALWADEEQRHGEEKAAESAAWELERVRWREEMEARQRQWKLEDDERKARREAEREAEEDAHRRKEKQEQERKERELEEIERQRQRLAWVNIVGEQGCLRYNTRAWYASLANVPRSLDPVEECMRTPLLLNGRMILPTTCSPEEICPYRARGMWVDNADESACKPNWGEFHNKGCIAPGLRKYDSQLQNLGFRDSWLDVCRTTPGNINGMIYYPKECNIWGHDEKWAVWVVPDQSC